jgi:hypothetical protein
MRGAISPLPNTPSWRGAQLKKAQEQLYLNTIIEGARTFEVEVTLRPIKLEY